MLPGTYKIYIKWKSTLPPGTLASMGPAAGASDAYATGGSGNVLSTLGNGDIRDLKETIVHEVGHLFNLADCLTASICSYSTTVMTSGVQRLPVRGAPLTGLTLVTSSGQPILDSIAFRFWRAASPILINS